MTNIVYAVFLALVSRLSGAIWTLAIGLLGGLGAAINEKGNSFATKGSGFLVMLLGQTYASLSYAAILIHLSERMIRPNLVGSSVAWIVVFFAACFPIYVAVKDGANTSPDERNVQHLTATLTLPLTIAGFFILKFIPSVRYPLWSWTNF